MQANTYAISSNPQTSDHFSAPLTTLDVLRGLQYSTILDSGMTQLVGDTLFAALRLGSEDRTTTFSTFAEGCSWLLGQEQCPNDFAACAMELVREAKQPRRSSLLRACYYSLLDRYETTSVPFYLQTYTEDVQYTMESFVEILRTGYSREAIAARQIRSFPLRDPFGLTSLAVVHPLEAEITALWGACPRFLWTS